MTRRRPLSVLPALVAAVLAGPAAGPAQAEGPGALQKLRLLPAVTKALGVPATTAARSCATLPAKGARRGLGRTTWRAPMSGHLTVRLRGTGDWDLRLRDAAGGRRLGAAQGLGGREVVQTWVAAGQRIVAEGCRRRGAGRTARITFRLADIAPPKAPAGAPKLVRVHASEARLRRLEELGFDITHNVGRGWADVLVAGDEQLGRLERTGLRFDVRQDDLRRTLARTRAADRRYRARVGAEGSPLPSGRTTYRTLDGIQSELKGLAEANPGLVRKVVLGHSFQGRELSGVEIATDVDADDGRPVHFLVALHHAREWPSAEAAMEFAHLLVRDRETPRIAQLLAAARIVILPVVNADGYVSSRSAFDPGDSLFGQDPTVTLVEGIAPPGGLFAYRRKNCNGELLGPSVPCELTWGVDPNRNYGNNWGGPGSSSDVTSQGYRGQAPRSEPEVQAVWDFARTHHVTSLVSIHNVAALVLRPPGLKGEGLAPDEARMKELGDAMGKAAGYTSQYGWQLYDTAGTTEDDTYAATGGYGYTIEMGPPDGGFHEPYEVGVVAEWTGDNGHSKGQGGLREALLLAAEAAASTADHAVLEGTAPAGRVLRLRKEFQTPTKETCGRGIEPILNVGLPALCLTGIKPASLIDDTMDTRTTVPAGGTFQWHIGQSTRPFVNGGAVKEDTRLVEPAIASLRGEPGAPTGSADHEVQIPQVGAGDKVRIHLSATLPEDYDLEVFRKAADGSLVPVGESGNLPGEDEEVLLDAPEAGTYVVRVVFYLAVSGAYEIDVHRVETARTVTTGRKEAYVLTCEDEEGAELERHSLVIDRGQELLLRLGCGAGPSTFADGSPLPGTPDAPLPAGTPSVDGKVAPVVAAGPPARARLALTARRTVRLGRSRVVPVTIACPAPVTGSCRGTLRLRAGGRTLGSKAFRVRAGRAARVQVPLTRVARRTVSRRGRLTVTATVAGARAGKTKLTGSRRITLRR